VCDFFLYTRSFTDPSSRRTRRVSDLLVFLFFVGELNVASGINGVNVVRKIPHLTLLYQFQNIVHIPLPIVTMALSCIISEIKRDIGRKSSVFYTPLAFNAQSEYCHSVWCGTRGQSNLTKSASRGAHSPVRGHPRGSKVVPLNSWGRVSY